MLLRMSIRGMSADEHSSPLRFCNDISGGYGIRPYDSQSPYHQKNNRIYEQAGLANKECVVSSPLRQSYDCHLSQSERQV